MLIQWRSCIESHCLLHLLLASSRLTLLNAQLTVDSYCNVLGYVDILWAASEALLMAQNAVATWNEQTLRVQFLLSALIKDNIWYSLAASKFLS